MLTMDNRMYKKMKREMETLGPLNRFIGCVECIYVYIVFEDNRTNGKKNGTVGSQGHLRMKCSGFKV